MAAKTPKLILEKNSDYRTITQSGVLGGHRPGFFEWVVYTDEMIADDVLSTIPPDPAKMAVKRTLQCRIVCTAIAANTFAQWLNNHIAEYEKNFGKLTPPGTKPAKGKKGPELYI